MTGMRSSPKRWSATARGTFYQRCGAFSQLRERSDRVVTDSTPTDSEADAVKSG